MEIKKEKLVKLINKTLLEMAMDFPRSIMTRQKNPRYNPNMPESDENPKFIEVEMPFTERPNQQVQRDLQLQKNPLKKVPMPEPRGGQNFQELLASEVYREVIKRAKEATGGNANNLMGLMMDAYVKSTQYESAHKEELEKLAVESVMDLFKIPRDSFNVFAKLVTQSQIPSGGFLAPQRGEEDVEAPDVSGVAPQAPDIENMDNLEVEEDYVDKLENFNLERAKRRLINAMTQGAAHSGYNLYSYIAPKLRRIIGPLPNGADIMDIYAIMMSLNDTLYWSLSDNQLGSLQASKAGIADIRLPQPEIDDDFDDDGGGGDEGDDEGGDDENMGEGVDTLGNPVDLNKPQIYVYGVNFPVLFHEMIKGVQKLIAAQGTVFPGYNPKKRKHVEFIEKLKKYEDILDYEVWDLRLGPGIWQRYRMMHPDRVINPDEKIELQAFIQMYIYKLPARKFLALMKEIMANTDRAKRIIETLTQGIERMLESEEYEAVMQEYEDDIDEIENETTDDDINDFLRNIGGIRLSSDRDEQRPTNQGDDEDTDPFDFGDDDYYDDDK